MGGHYHAGFQEDVGWAAVIEALETCGGQGDAALHLHHPASVSSSATSASDAASADWELVSGDDNNCSDDDSCGEDAQEASAYAPVAAKPSTMES